MQNFKMNTPWVNPQTANDEQKELFNLAKKEAKMIPNMYKAMANLPALLDTYLHGYKKFRKGGGFTPCEQEVVFLTISAENGCIYCMGAHSLIADVMSKVPVEVTEAIRNDTEIPDTKLRALAQFTSAMINQRGRPTDNDVQQFLAVGYTEKHILSIILGISVKTISNYTNHVFDTELDGVFKAREWKGYKATRKFINFFRKSD